MICSVLFAYGPDEEPRRGEGVVRVSRFGFPVSSAGL